MPGFQLPNWQNGDITSLSGFSGITDPNIAMDWGLPVTPSYSTGSAAIPSLAKVSPVSGAGLPGSSSGLGFNLGTAQLGLSGLATIGNLWAAFQAQKLAKDQFNYTKNVTDTNLANSIQTYNTGITDRANNRAIVEGRTPDQTQAYITANSLKRYGS